MRLEVNRLNKSFEQNHVLKDLSFIVNSGAAFGYLGRNGSGKTTTIRIIMDIFAADSGEVLVDGKKMADAGVRIGYLPEERGLYPKRIIADQMVYLGQLRGMTAKDAKRSGEALLKRLDAEQYFKKRLDTLSKGNQQKIQLAIALINDPDIVILDEPFSGLDPVNAKLLKELVSDLVRQGKMVLFSSHQMANVEAFCDDIALINNGTIVLAGNLNKIKATYPRNKILLTPENGKTDTLAQWLATAPAAKKYTAGVEKVRHGCIVTLPEEQAKAPLFAALGEAALPLDAFTVVEPTLEEIFVEKAGDSHERP